MNVSNNFKTAHKFLCDNFEVVLPNESELLSWILGKEDLNSLIESINQNTSSYLKKFEGFSGDLHDIPLKNAFNCYVYSVLYDAIIAKFYRDFVQEDAHIYEKCLNLNNFTNCKHNFDNIALPAAVVELASLDFHKTAEEKANCLFACYDLIFAELKMALVEIIAESEAQTIPIVNNSDFLPVLMNVIVQAKPQHFYTNLTYIYTFGGELLENNEFRIILSHFERAIDEILNSSFCYFREENLCKQLDICQYYQISAQSNEGSNENKLFNNSMRRFCKLIALSQEKLTKY